MSVFRNENHFFAERPGTCVLRGETKRRLGHGSAPCEFSSTDRVTLRTRDMGREGGRAAQLLQISLPRTVLC